MFKAFSKDLMCVAKEKEGNVGEVAEIAKCSIQSWLGHVGRMDGSEMRRIYTLISNVDLYSRIAYVKF